MFMNILSCIGRCRSPLSEHPGADHSVLALARHGAASHFNHNRFPSLLILRCTI
jgi:hypothetical protein